MLEAVLGRQEADAAVADAAAGRRRRGGLGASARNAAVVSEAYPESEAHAGTGAADGEQQAACLCDWGALASQAPFQQLMGHVALCMLQHLVVRVATHNTTRTLCKMVLACSVPGCPRKCATSAPPAPLCLGGGG